MRHLDEGQLQAWLDGPRAGLADPDRAAVDHHLAECAECTARADALRECTARVQGLLAPAGAEEPPPFDTVRARARTAHPTRRRRRVWVAAGWAASVVVALGIGWLWSEGGGEPADAVAVVERSPEPQAEPAPPAEPVETPEDPSPRPAEAAPQEATARAEVAAGRSAEAGIAAAPSGEPVVVRGRVVDAGSGRAIPGAQVYVEDDDSILQGTLTRGDGTFTMALDALADSAVEEVTLVAELIGFASQRRSLSLVPADTVASEFQMSSEALALEGIVVTGVSGSQPWRRVSRDEAEEIAGFPVRIVAGLPVLAVGVRTGGAGPQVRVVQPLDDGARLVLLQAGHALSAEDPGTDATLTRRLKSGVFLVASAPLPPDSLHSLLSGIR